MSRLNELIQKLCPDGVEFKKLGDVCYILDYKRKPISKSKRNFGNYPYYGANGIQDYIDDFLFDGTFLLIGEDGSVINKNNSPVLNWATGKIWVNNHAHVLSEMREIMLLRFLYFTLSEINISDIVRGIPPKLNQENLRNIKVPVPPLDVQNEIVRILDTFTSHTAELQAELQARKEQYEYYRNKLLTFDKDDKNVKWMKLDEVFEMRNGYTPSKSKQEYWSYGDIPWFRLEDIRQNGRILYDSIQHITKKAVKGGKLFNSNSFIITTTATIGEHALIMKDSLANQRFTNLDIRKSLKDGIDIKYLYYYLFIVGEWCRRNTNFSGFASVDMKRFKKLQIPIPSLTEQQRIVSILDKFEALVNDLTEGLPAEIAAVQEQYEYYRNKLLTFKQK